ncbi:hypothetical protein HX109_15415 [Galbibacter sp. BG1]|uniref:hypothetical protein n=1 Tax=Galbibacter sp. BG1 TaxID=1170699 RepID=UPI0015BE395C|nr:hypothetical protein [Galbibacter sp. BG1]QLE02888.1 hypothetical protein HX109_15415 [Galbibacter sp. BG1]
MAKQSKKVSVKITKSLWGKFNLPYVPGKVYDIEDKLATELIEGGFAISKADAEKSEELKEEK